MKNFCDSRSHPTARSPIESSRRAESIAHIFAVQRAAALQCLDFVEWEPHEACPTRRAPGAPRVPKPSAESTAWALSSRRRFRSGSLTAPWSALCPVKAAAAAARASHARLLAPSFAAASMLTCTSRSRALGADALTCSAVFSCPLALVHAVLSSVPRVL
jgi:hypothetical protein